MHFLVIFNLVLKGSNINNPGWANKVNITRGQKNRTRKGASAKANWNNPALCAAKRNLN